MEINEKTKETLKLYLVHNMKNNSKKGSYRSHLSYISLNILRSMKRREIEDDKQFKRNKKGFMCICKKM